MHNARMRKLWRCSEGKARGDTSREPVRRDLEEAKKYLLLGVDEGKELGLTAVEKAPPGLRRILEPKTEKNEDGAD